MATMVNNKSGPGSLAGRRPETGKKVENLRRKERIGIRIVSRSDKDPDPERRLMWGDHWVKYELTREFISLGLDVVEEDPDVILHLFGSPPKSLPDHTYNLVWLYSHPDLVTPDNLRGFDRIFCAAPDFIPGLRAMGYDRVETMAACTSKVPVEEPIAHDLIFLGNARGSRSDGRSVVGILLRTGHAFKVWGNLWENRLPPEYHGGRYWDYRQLERLYASALITVNDHHPDMAREGFVSNKVFDILAGGGFVISDTNPGLAKIFGEAVPQFQTTEQLRDLVDFYLKNPAQRERLMLEGRKIALANTYRDRAARLVRDFRPDISRPAS